MNKNTGNKEALKKRKPVVIPLYFDIKDEVWHILKKMSARGSKILCRGYSPDRERIVELKDAGIKSIINLQKEDISNKDFIKNLGMKFFHIPIEDYTAPSVKQIEEFISITADEGNYPLYVHCRAGLERTGTMVACYRIYNRWDCEEAIDYNYDEVYCSLLDEQKKAVREYVRKLNLKGKRTS